MSSKWCDDCGTIWSDGCCPNCHEELFIVRTQSEYIDYKLSEDFQEKLKEQERQVLE